MNNIIEKQTIHYSPSEAVNPTWSAAAYILNKIITDQNSDPREKIDAIKTLIAVTENFIDVAQCMDNFIDEEDADIRRRALPRN